MTRARRVALVLLALVPPLSACADTAVRGQALYRERIALPPGAVFEATLEDVSRPGAPAEVLGTARVENAGAVPIRFEIPYDAGRIDERHTYSVRGRILAGGELLFTSDRANLVLTRGAGNEVEVLLVQARGGAAGTLPLEGTRWNLVSLGGAPVEGLRQPAHLVFASEPRRVSGSGSCNRLEGPYERGRDRLRFGVIATTSMACISGGDIERAFFAALARVETFRIAGNRLELLDASGSSLATLSADVAAVPDAAR